MFGGSGGGCGVCVKIQITTANWHNIWHLKRSYYLRLVAVTKLVTWVHSFFFFIELFAICKKICSISHLSSRMGSYKEKRIVVNILE